MENIVVITGGGTGGHLKVAKAFENELNKREIKSMFIGSINTQDKQWFNIENGYNIFLNTTGVVNKRLIGKIRSLFNIIKSSLYCLYIFRKFNIKQVISVGGFSAAPACIAAILTYKCKLYIHEQNSKMGSLNQLTYKFSKELFSSYNSSSIVKDYPVDKIFFDKCRIRSSIKTVIFLGGSQGAVFINDFALNIAKDLNSMNIKIIHQTGKKDFKRVEDFYKSNSIDVDVFDFDINLIYKIQKSDFAVSRSGASTLWELTANALPALYIPYSYAFKDHQFYNANYLFKKGLCFLKRESQLKPFDLFECLNQNISLMSKNLKNSIKENSIEKIVDVIVKT